MSASQILFSIVTVDALAILVMGVIAAVLILLNKESEIFWKRVVPATAMLIGTSFASGIVFWIGERLFT